MTRNSLRIKSSAVPIRVRDQIDQYNAAKAERPNCAFKKTLLGVSEGKAVIEDTGVRMFVGEESFFNEFVFQVCDPKHAKPARKRRAADDIPGLARCDGGKGVRWRLSFRRFARDADVRMVEQLFKKIGGDTPLQRRVCGADERNRFLSDALI